MKGQETRKVERRVMGPSLMENIYVALKPSRFGLDVGWERHGRHYNIKGVRGLVQGNTYVFILDSDVKLDLEAYEVLREQRRQQYKEWLREQERTRGNIRR